MELQERIESEERVDAVVVSGKCGEFGGLEGALEAAGLTIVRSAEIPSAALLVKSLVWRVQDTLQPLVLVLKQGEKVLREQVERLIHGKASLVSEAEASILSGYQIGHIPPYGHKVSMPVHVDYNVIPSTWRYHDEKADSQEDDSNTLVYMGASVEGSELCIPLAELLRLPGVSLAFLTCKNKISPDSDVSKSPLPTPTSAGGHVTIMNSLSSISSFQKVVMKCKSRHETPDMYEGIVSALHNGLFSGYDSNDAGKNSLHFAAWRGCLDVIALLLQYVDINTISTGCGNYGKSALFYAITRNRDDVVLYLLSQGASVLIVNNKGQTPYSLGLSHLQVATMAVIEQMEHEQLLSHKNDWENYYASHCDGRDYGDLDPRFVVKSHSHAVDNVRLKLIPCWDVTLHSSESDDHCATRKSRLHQLVYVCDNNVIVLDTIRLSKSLQFTTIKSRAEKVARVREQSLHPKSATKLKNVAISTRKNKSQSEVVSFKDGFLEDVSFCGVISGVQKSGNGFQLARLSPSANLLKSDAELKRKNVNDNFFFLNTTDVFSKLPVESSDASAIAVIVYLDIPTDCLNKATFGSNKDSSVLSNIQQLIDCVVRIRGKCVPTNLKQKISNSKANQDDTMFGTWRFDILVRSLEILVLSSSPQQSDAIMPDKILDTPPRKLKALYLPIISSRDALLQEHIQSFRTLSSALSLKIAMENSCSNRVLSREDIQGLRSTDVSIVLVDSLDSLSLFREELKLSSSHNGTSKQIWAVDCEWKAEPPVENKNRKVFVTVLQLSTRTKAFVFDLQHLLVTSATVTIQNELNSVLLEVFASVDNLILGYGAKQDLENLHDSYPSMSCFDFRSMRSKFENKSEGNVLDLQPSLGCVFEKLPNVFIENVNKGDCPKQKRGNQYSLSDACDIVLKLKLCKDMQLSDWTERPLSIQQLEYAALDVLVLCLMFDVVVSKIFNNLKKDT